MVNQLSSLVLAFFGLTLLWLIAGAWWPLARYAAICFIFWGLGIETRVLCSHCPFYAEDSNVMHCHAFKGYSKLWRYRPWPMSGAEKVILLLFFLLLFFISMVAEAYGVWLLYTSSAGLYAILGMAGVTLATILAGLQFYYILTRYFCARCINFSCPSIGSRNRWLTNT